MLYSSSYKRLENLLAIHYYRGASEYNRIRKTVAPRQVLINRASTPPPAALKEPKGAAALKREFFVLESLGHRGDSRSQRVSYGELITQSLLSIRPRELFESQIAQSLISGYLSPMKSMPLFLSTDSRKSLFPR